MPAYGSSSSLASAASGCWVMLTTSQPALRNHVDSARVEKRGPWTTTTVPPSCTVIPRRRAPATNAARSAGSYGSASDTWWGPSANESKNVSGRPHVRSTNWSHTTKSPGWMCGCSEPAANGPSSARTPSSFIAHTFARYGTVCGGNWWRAPWRGMKATRVSPSVPITTGAAGSPYGVTTSTSSTSSRNV